MSISRAVSTDGPSHHRRGRREIHGSVTISGDRTHKIRARGTLQK
jgi:hypothetical protein